MVKAKVISGLLATSIGITALVTYFAVRVPRVKPSDIDSPAQMIIRFRPFASQLCVGISSARTPTPSDSVLIYDVKTNCISCDIKTTDSAVHPYKAVAVFKQRFLVTSNQTDFLRCTEYEITLNFVPGGSGWIPVDGVSRTTSCLHPVPADPDFIDTTGQEHLLSADDIGAFVSKAGLQQQAGPARR